ncbi:formate dehydrogenase subunit gamma [Litorivicinus sp.]|jgi:formate dehydrogenase subunit gamma|nr:formate dehydrogenase subunit gamma [Litorivicinus sp.]MDC1319118.1 formate dehydrogenase subunit gamma [Litorivicinus sp.]|tara:strand:+ start:4195 stop:5361 length:1167 start_codon:yes stop_codon:yes gene_type:complete
MKIQVIGSFLVAVLTLAIAPSYAEQSDGQRASTGGAQTLQDVLARQKGIEVDESFRRENLGDPDKAQSINNMLGTQGGISNADVYRGIRYSEVDIKVSNNGPAADVLVQDGGISWLITRATSIRGYAGYGIGGILVALIAFYFTRGRMTIEGGPSGQTIERFKSFERFGHWCLAGSFIMLSATGLLLLFGRAILIPVFGHEANAAIATFSIWVHNNIAWVFMGSLVAIFLMWVAHNIPNKLDWDWLKQGGGIIGNAHPSAQKFNAGQKIIFWMTIIMGASVSVSGLSLLFPFQMPMFAETFALINAVTGSALPAELLPHEEMQLSHLWHAIVAITMIIAIVAHIYIGSVGMEGAFDAMGSGQVDLEWARQHHDLWVEEEEAKAGQAGR